MLRTAAKSQSRGLQHDPSDVNNVLAKLEAKTNQVKVKTRIIGFGEQRVMSPFDFASALFREEQRCAAASGGRAQLAQPAQPCKRARAFCREGVSWE